MTSRLGGLVIGVALALVPLSAGAITLLPPCIADGNCGITDMLAVFINIGEFLLGITGAVALAFFIWGGFQMILSAGNKDKVQKGKDTIVRATIGIFIIFLSGVIVRFTGEALTGTQSTICKQIGKSQNYSINGETGGEPCVPKVGDSCASDSIWISLPAGYRDEADPAASFVPEGLYCMKTSNETGKAGCKLLNEELTGPSGRHRPAEEGTYTCMSTSDPKASRCVRGLCGGGADYACCIPK